MGLLDTVREAVAPAERGAESSAGAYWCHECSVRVRDVDAESDSPLCPECGDEMAFERSPDSAGCAC